MPSDRMFLDSVDSAELTAIARSTHPRVARWVGIRGGGSRKTLECYICDRTVATFSAEWRMPRHAMQAVTEHRDAHLTAHLTAE
jgi:hypothetical protein